MECRRARHAGDDEPARRQLRGVARQVAPGLRVHDRVAGHPDHRPVVGIPVALLELDVYVSDAHTMSAIANWIAADTSTAGCSLASSHMTASLPGVSASNTRNPTAWAPTPTAP